MDNIAQGVVEFYSNLFLEEYQTRPFPSNYNPPCLNSAESASLEKPFTEEEIWECLSDSDGTKAPGPDGFSFEFYKRCWNFVKIDVLNCFSEFFATGRLPKIATHSFICLVPKKGATEDIKDLRPIGLMGSVNKFICKVLSKRLGQVLPAVVSVSQHASVRGRQISEAGLIANELVDSRRRSKKPGLLIKLDIEKAFDNVSWSCLFTVLARLGFKEKWRQWILGAVCSPTISVLINGESKGFFTAHKGLRQGDPLSPGLFVLVMDILSFMLSKLKEDGKIKGFFMNEEEQRGEVTHLLFADDTLIFCDASPDQILHIKATLACFQAVTGLKINLDKKVIYTVGDVPEPEFFANILGCNWSSNPPKYLGYPLGAKLNVISFWDPILLNYKKKLESWSSRYLSAGGRLVLLKSVLSNLSGYYFSLFKAPKKVIEDMEKVQRKFLWSGVGDKRKTPLVEWMICKSNRNNGGLGIRDLATFNSAMLCKWLWKYGVNSNGWWRTLIDIKYSKGKSQWHTGGSRGGSSSSVWVTIMKEAELFWNLAQVEPGSGAFVSFWYDRWISNPSLAVNFPRIAAVTTDLDARINDIVELSGDNVSIQLHTNIDLRRGAEQERHNLISLLNSYNFIIGANSPCRLVWLPDQEAGFSVKSMYRTLLEDRCPGVPHFPAESVWRKIVPSKICIFIWTVAHNSILTQDKLQKRGWNLANRCDLCYMNEETTAHLLADCNFTKQVWSIIRRSCKPSVFPSGNDLDSILKNWPTDTPDCMED
ncbi:unnamed protein product [Linum trigynum]|uniref:Reverse transcriptase domain-containing protein n=1 Tax=Linum trigynum TaxID=586398 RepID=A0AAV2D8C7_9ROSI